MDKARKAVSDEVLYWVFFYENVKYTNILF